MKCMSVTPATQLASTLLVSPCQSSPAYRGRAPCTCCALASNAFPAFSIWQTRATVPRSLISPSGSFPTLLLQPCFPHFSPARSFSSTVLSLGYAPEKQGPDCLGLVQDPAHGGRSVSGVWFNGCSVMGTSIPEPHFQSSPAPAFLCLSNSASSVSFQYVPR